MTLAQRVLSRCTSEQASLYVDTPCLVWQGSLTSQGYGQIRQICSQASTVAVHRVTFEDAYGPIPPGLEPDHLCEVKRCCRPDHMEAVTHRENIRRHYSRRSRGRDPVAA